MNKKTAGMIAAGIGLTAAVGVAAVSKAKNSKMAHKAYRNVMSIKEEFADELGYMAKRAGKAMIKAGRSIDKFGK